MLTLFKKFSASLLVITMAFSCGNNTPPANVSSTGSSGNAAGSAAKIYFSCKVNGVSLTDNTDGGILDPVTGMLLTSGESEDYIVGIRIPPGLKQGQTCNGCKGFVHKKIKHEGGITENRIYEKVENISLTVTERQKGYAAGTFSFTVKLKEDSDTRIAVTDGKFGMSVINDN